MEKYYTSEKNVQMLIYLMKAHGIRKIVVSPGAMNICLVGSLQQDSYFEIYSSVDERSAAYIACGLAAESREPVALSCTGATASRNYLPGLTEAFYRKLPVLAITSAQHAGRIGQLIPQAIDRTNCMNDIAKISIQLPLIHDEEDEWAYGVAINKALLELRRHGGGPVHINLVTGYSRDFSVRDLPRVKVIRRTGYYETIPELKACRTAIYVGAHGEWESELTEAVDKFCDKYNGVVLCEHISNYKGKYGVYPALITNQEKYDSPYREVDIMIHIGEIGAYGCNMKPKEVWRVSPDGEVRDTFRTLTRVFEMEERDFFERYVSLAEKNGICLGRKYYMDFSAEIVRVKAKIPELPFGSAWIAQHTYKKLPEKSILHLGILNTIRNWSFFILPDSVLCYANTGGFGIDGMASALLGASFADKSRLHFGIIGDLGFFYDMNSIGNRHLGNNFRLMVVNNGRGTEFRNYNHPAQRFGDAADSYMAAAGHYGNKSSVLVRDYAEALGFQYISASNKKEYLEKVDIFLLPQITDKPILFEVFTDTIDESDSLKMLYNLELSTAKAAKNAVKDFLGENNVQMLKKILKK